MTISAVDEHDEQRQEGPGDRGVAFGPLPEPRHRSRPAREDRLAVQHAAEVLRERERRLVPPSRSFSIATATTAERSREIAGFSRRGSGGSFVEDRLVELLARGRIERAHERQRLVERDSERVHVGPAVEVDASAVSCSGAMYCGVPIMSPVSVRVGPLAADGVREAEVEDHGRRRPASP